MMWRYLWLPKTLLILCATLSAGENKTFNLVTASVMDIQEAVDSGALTYEQLVQKYLNRIDAYDKSGPKLNAVLEVHPRALEIARELDRERHVSGRRSLLHGIPIAIKDTVDVMDIPSAGGNELLAGTFPSHDATVVRRLRKAGAIIFLKANLDEFNMDSKGLSGLGGQVLNPYDLTKTPGGSSAGPGVAVNASFATLGIATETGASIRSPASNNGLVGIAPSQGLVSRAGVIAISYTQDRVGVHAKSVADAALMLTYMRGFDAEDLFTWESLGKLNNVPYTDYVNDDGLTGARIGVLRDLFRQGAEFEEINNLIEAQIQLLSSSHQSADNTFTSGSGAVVVDGLTTGMDLIAFIPNARASIYEFQSAFDVYLKNRGPDTPVRSLDELIATGQYLKSMDPAFELTRSVTSLDFDQRYLSRLKNRLTIRKLVIELMDRHQVEALVYPFKALAAPPVGTSDRGPRDNPLSAVTGLPAIVVPAGMNSEGLPISIEFLGRPFSEPTLIRLAHAYEKISQKRVTPHTTPPLAGDVLSYN